MKIKKLIKELQKLDPELEIIVSSDSEGNNFSALQDVSLAEYYRNKDDEFGHYTEIEIYDMEDEDKPANTKKCVILFP